MDSNTNTQHKLLCIKSSTKSQKALTIQGNIAVYLDMNKAFDTVNKNKLLLTNIPNTIIKFIANYI